MSADNSIAILITKDLYKYENEHTTSNTFGKGIIAYRVAHIQAADNFEYIKEHELHNLGAWMKDNFPDMPTYTRTEAEVLAMKYLEIIGYVEYGIIDIDATEYNFPGC